MRPPPAFETLVRQTQPNFPTLWTESLVRLNNETGSSNPPPLPYSGFKSAMFDQREPSSTIADADYAAARLVP